MGITDSIMYPGTMSFERFEYPSRLPVGVQERMSDIARQVILGIGLDNTMFNMEMFYKEETDAIHIIEINPRMSYQFADLFEKVDGTNSYSVQLQLSQGQEPEFANGKGEYTNRGQKKILGIKYTPDFIGKDYIIECKGRANESFPLRWKLFKLWLTKNKIGKTLYKPQNQKEVDLTMILIKERRKKRG